jgi:hypothetical protein
MFGILLIGIIKNSVKNTFHPIMYVESPLPGPIESQPEIYRFKSKGHHTSGFATREEALAETQKIVTQVKEKWGSIIYLDVENDFFEWDGEFIPADVLVRSVAELQKFKVSEVADTPAAN